MSLDIPIGGRVELDGCVYECFEIGEDLCCEGCCFLQSHLCYDVECEGVFRKDGKSVIFKEVSNG